MKKFIVVLMLTATVSEAAPVDESAYGATWYQILWQKRLRSREDLKKFLEYRAKWLYGSKETA